jgi:hypothetical protein
LTAAAPYADLRRDYEAAVPSFDRLEAVGVVLSGADWGAIEGLSAKTAVHGLVNFFTFDPSPVMAVNGNTRHVVTYLAGNIIKAEHGFRIEPGMFLYLPMRLVITDGPDGGGVLAFDLPADLFEAFDDARLDVVQADFTATLVCVLRLLDLPVPDELNR